MSHKDNIIAAATVAGGVAAFGWILQLAAQAMHDAQDRSTALWIYAQKTKGHVEKYKTGEHVESQYASTYTIGSGNSATTYTMYQPVVVEDYANRIIYFDGRTPYYPEDHGEWLEELARIRREHGDK